MNFLHARTGMEIAIKNAVTMTEEIRGVLFQNIHLTGDGKDRLAGLTGPMSLKRMLQECSKRRGVHTRILRSSQT